VAKLAREFIHMAQRQLANLHRLEVADGVRQRYAGVAAHAFAAELKLSRLGERPA